MGPGFTLTMAQLNLLKEAPSSDEDSPLKEFKPQILPNGTLSPTVQGDRIGLPKIKNYYSVYRNMDRALDQNMNEDS